MSLGAEATVAAASRLSRLLGLSEAVIGFVLVAFATSVPELAISLVAVINGNVGISIGNLLGSNITDLTLVIGIAALLAPVPIMIRRSLIQNLSTILFITSLFPLLLISVAADSRMIGVILLAVFGMYLFTSLKTRRPLPPLRDRFILRGGGLLNQVVMLMSGIAAVIIGSNVVVLSAVSIAELMGITQVIIGATIIAVGTSLPELAVAITAVLRKRYELALGNAMGSALTNLGLILGLVLVFTPIVIEFAIFSSLVSFLIATNLIVWYFVVNRKISRLGGLLLFMIYVLFLITSFFTSFLR